MAGYLADFIAVFGVPVAAFMLCLIPPMILEELELHRAKKKRPTGEQTGRGAKDNKSFLGYQKEREKASVL